MNATLSRTKPLALEPVASTPDDAAVQRQLRITIADPFLAEAAQEYQDGNVDRALWARASAQSGDESLVIAAYLRARATALRLERRDRRSDNGAPRAASGQPAPSETHSDIEPEKSVGFRGWVIRRKLLAAGAAALASVVALVWVIAVPRQVESVQPAVSSAPPPNRSAPPKAPVSEQPAVGDSGGKPSKDVGEATLEARVQQLKNAGNWNVLVLYASEWTRKEPNNAAAWNDLGVGYANLHQLNDALGAATKAVQLSPADALLWRNLGQVNLALERLPEAAIAFDKAIGVNPDDVVALCAAALVAQRQGRPKDADAIAARVKSVDGSCRGMGDADSAMFIRPAARKPASPAGR